MRREKLEATIMPIPIYILHGVHVYRQPAKDRRRYCADCDRQQQ